jgi:hypothetical protein
MQAVVVRSVSGVCACRPRQRRAVVEVFVAVPLTGWNPPRSGGHGDVELGQLVVDAHVLQLRLVREFVAEPEPSSYTRNTMSSARLRGSFR